MTDRVSDKPPPAGEPAARAALQNHAHELRQQPSPGSSTTVRIDGIRGKAYDDRGHFMGDMQPGLNGSGVIVGKNGGDVYIATDNHVANPSYPGTNVHAVVSDRMVTMPDGRRFHATLAAADPKHDLAYLKVHMSAKDAERYKAAKLSDDEPPAQGKGEVTGFPDGSKKLHTEPVEFDGTRKIGDVVRDSKGILLPGEDPNRQALWMKGKTHEGESGGGVWKGGALVALEEGGTPNGKNSFANPLSRKTVHEWLPNVKLD